ncbi:30S ribosomal protein S18, partial [Mycolicibacterium obuense]|uniref:30S ribosomal protein S18 n=1 Tax=Mycolicibacterium obuense TaxID=1807 RepID=UPI001EED1F40
TTRSRPFWMRWKPKIQGTKPYDPTRERGKIRSRLVTGVTVQQQKQVATAIKNAREMALLPYPGQG